MENFNNDLMKHFRFISKANREFMHQHKQRFTGQQRVLSILDIEDGLNQSYLAKILDLRPSSMAELLKKMEISGDITRQEDDNDKRIKRIFLTEEGKVKAAKNAESAKPGNFFAGLNDEEQAQFDALLTKISDGWSDDFKEKAANFVDPKDRLKAMQDMREQYMAQFENADPEEIEKIRKQMKHEMHDKFRHMHKDMRDFRGGMMGGHPHHGHGHDMRNDFFNNRGNWE